MRSWGSQAADFSSTSAIRRLPSRQNFCEDFPQESLSRFLREENARSQLAESRFDRLRRLAMAGRCLHPASIEFSEESCRGVQSVPCRKQRCFEAFYMSR